MEGGSASPLLGGGSGQRSLLQPRGSRLALVSKNARAAGQGLVTPAGLLCADHPLLDPGRTATVTAVLGGGPRRVVVAVCLLLTTRGRPNRLGVGRPWVWRSDLPFPAPGLPRHPHSHQLTATCRVGG